MNTDNELRALLANEEWPWQIKGLERLINDAYIEISKEDRFRLMWGRELLKDGKRALVPFNHLALPDPPFIAGLLLRHWRGVIKNIQIPASQKFYDGRMGKPGEMALRLAEQIGLGMPPIIQNGDDRYSSSEKRRVNFKSAEILKAALQNEGGVVPYAPEGTRSRDGSANVALSFADNLFGNKNYPYEEHVFVQPLALWGTEKFWPINKKYPNPFHRIHVHVGEPITLIQLREEAEHYDFSRLNEAVMPDGQPRGQKPIGDMIMLHIAAMLPPEYRGVYGHLVG